MATEQTERDKARALARSRAAMYLQPKPYGNEIEPDERLRTWSNRIGTRGGNDTLVEFQAGVDLGVGRSFA